VYAIPLCCFYPETPFVLLPYEHTQCTRLPWLTASTADITPARLPSRCQLTPRKKAFSDEEFIKECLLDSVALICPEKKGTFENEPLSRHSNEAGWGHCGKLGASADEQSGRLGLFFSGLDESCNVRDTAQLLIFLRGITADCQIPKKLAAMQSIKGTTTWSNLFTEVNACLDKLAGVATDGCPSLTGKMFDF